MNLEYQQHIPKLKESLLKGELCVIPTDTIYGVVGLATDPTSIEKLYALKERPKNKPFIVGISDIDTLETFGVVLTETLQTLLKLLWQEPLTVVLQTERSPFPHLTASDGSIAFRKPSPGLFLDLISAVGPLCAPSANPSGKPPATNIIEAKIYFKENVSMFIDGGTRVGKPSTIIKVTGKTIHIIREGRTPREFLEKALIKTSFILQS